jgi:hypothetical protein
MQHPITKNITSITLKICITADKLLMHYYTLRKTKHLPSTLQNFIKSSTDEACINSTTVRKALNQHLLKT